MKKIMILSVFFALCLAGCASTGPMDLLKGLSKLMGGPPDRKALIEQSVAEELEREFKRCLDGDETNVEKRTACVQEAYAIVKENKGLDEVFEGGEVIIIREDENSISNENLENSQEEAENDQ